MSGVGGERQRQEGRQGLAQIRVAGEDGVDHAAAVLGGNRLAGGDRAPQPFGPEAAAQASHGFLRVAGEDRLAGIDQHQQAILGRAPQAPGLRFGGVAGAAHQAGHVIVMGLHQVVEQPLAPVEQKADEQAVALVGRKAPQGTAIVAPAQVRELLTNPLGHLGEIGQIGQHDRDLVQPLAGFTGETPHRRRRGRAVAAEGGTALRTGVVGQLTDQPVEGRAQGCGKAGGDAVEQAVQGLAGDGGDQPFERGAGGQDDLRRGQRRFRPLDQVGCRQAIGGDRREIGLQTVLGVGGKHREPEVVAHPGADGAVGRLAGQKGQPGRWIDPELAGQVDDGAPRDLLRVVDETAGAAHAAQVQRGPQAVVRTAGAHDLPEVGLVERPVVQDPVRVDLLRSGLSHRD